ncbi:MAG TPA: hypothetical protein VJN70_06200 [Gemmatimonadaceae bacterium]|nr:hypothetical protein [Gemmatimonadaceae bacterium]
MIARRIAGCVALCLFASVPAWSQTPAHQHDGMAGMDHAAMGPVSAQAQREIAEVAKATQPLGVQTAAATAGFKPVFGWIPTMGVHWVDDSRMAKDKQSDLTAPDNLMFSKINGRDSLVGAAYAYFTPVADTARPALFDGTPAWHQHQDLAPPGETLVMLHVWFVPSPDGPFAGTNPNLPFWAAGLAAPDSSRMHDATFNSRVRRAGLGIADVTDTLSIFPRMARRPDVQVAVQPYRDSLRAIIPELLAAQKAKDVARWDRAAERAATQWDAVYQTYLAHAPSPLAKQLMEKRVAMLLGKHAH